MANYNDLAGKQIERIAALSDGVFAIALTLIVLEIRVPEGTTILNEAGLLRALSSLAPEFLSYAVSFLTIGIFWIGQQTQLDHLIRSDRNLSWLHLIFLAIVALLPFSTRLLAEYPEFQVAILAYWLNIVGLGLMLYLHWRYSDRHGLIDPELPNQATANICRRIVRAQTLYAVAAALVFVAPALSIAMTFFVQLYYAIAPRIRWLEAITG